MNKRHWILRWTRPNWDADKFELLGYELVRIGAICALAAIVVLHMTGSLQ